MAPGFLGVPTPHSNWAIERTPSLLPAGCNYGQESLGTPTARLAVRPETALPPQPRRLQGALGHIVGRLDSLDSGEGPQRRPPFVPLAAEGRRCNRSAPSLRAGRELASAPATQYNRGMFEATLPLPPDPCLMVVATC
jgi:hypothetical protein